MRRKSGMPYGNLGDRGDRAGSRHHDRKGVALGRLPEPVCRWLRTGLGEYVWIDKIFWSAVEKGHHVVDCRLDEARITLVGKAAQVRLHQNVLLAAQPVI
jgi:hypothetical protein